jgi:hypothetical protein
MYDSGFEQRRLLVLVLCIVIGTVLTVSHRTKTRLHHMPKSHADVCRNEVFEIDRGRKYTLTFLYIQISPCRGILGFMCKVHVRVV